MIANVFPKIIFNKLFNVNFQKLFLFEMFKKIFPKKNELNFGQKNNTLFFITSKKSLKNCSS